MTKHQLNQRIQRIVAHRNNPSASVDAATLLLEEGQRLAVVKHPLAQKMSWAFRLAATKLEAWCDPAMLVNYKKV